MEKATLDRVTLENVIKESVTACIDENGWANLAKIGFQLSKRGINIKALGYKKLWNFLKDFPELVALKSDESINPPVAYAKLNQV